MNAEGCEEVDVANIFKDRAKRQCNEFASP